MVTVAALLYLSAALAAQRMGRDLLGPEHHPDCPSLRQALSIAGGELLDGMRHLAIDCRPAMCGLAAVSVARFCYGVPIVVVLMLSRYTFNSAADSSGGLATLGLAVGLSAVGSRPDGGPWGHHRALRLFRLGQPGFT